MPFNTSLTTLTGTAVGPLVIQPLQRESVAFAVTTLVTTDQARYRIPTIVQDPAADWIAANAEIPTSESVGDEVSVEPKKLAALSYVANELASDSSPEASAIIGEGMARDIARRIDVAFFSEGLPANVNRPDGLGSIPVAELSGINADPAVSLDAWVDALAAAEAVGTAPTHWITDPATASAIAKLKTGTGSNALLLGQGADNGIGRSVLGIPVLVSPAVKAGTVWGLTQGRVYSILRSDVTVDIDRSARFEFDQTAVRTTLRTGWLFPDPKSIVKITKTP